MTRSAPDPEWELLHAIDPLHDPQRAPALQLGQREDLFSNIIASHRESMTGPRLAGVRVPLPTAIKPLSASHPGRVLAALGACGTTFAAGIVALILLLTTGTSPAYAGWSPTPHAVSRSQATTLTSRCRTNAGIATNPTYPHGHDTGVVFAGQPVLTETRGVFTAAIYVTDSRVYSCLYGARGDAYIVHEESSGPVHAAPGPERISAPYGIAFAPGDPNGGSGRGDTGKVAPWLARLATEVHDARPDSARWQRLAEQAARLRKGGGYGFDTYGQAGSDVTAVLFEFANGRSVTATVQNGWYFAWWPWTTYPNSVEISTSTGTTTSPMTTTGRGIVALKPSPACQPGTAGCAFDSTRTSAAARTTTSTAP